MTDSKYSLNGVDLYDTLGLAQLGRARWTLNAMAQPAPPAHKGGTFDSKSQNGVQLAAKGLNDSSYLPLSISITGFGNPDDEDSYTDSVKNFRENREFLRSLLFAENWPLLRYFPWLPSNVEIPELSDVEAYYYFYDSRARIVPGSVSWAETGNDRAILNFVLELPSGRLSSKINSWLPEASEEAIVGYTDAYAYPQMIFTNAPQSDFVLEFERDTDAGDLTLLLAESGATSEDAPSVKIVIPTGVKKGAVWLKENIAFHDDSFDIDFTYDYDASSDENWLRLKKEAYDSNGTPGVLYDAVKHNTLRATDAKNLVLFSSEPLSSESAALLRLRIQAV